MTKTHCQKSLLIARIGVLEKDRVRKIFVAHVLHVAKMQSRTHAL